MLIEADIIQNYATVLLCWLVFRAFVIADNVVVVLVSSYDLIAPFYSREKKAHTPILAFTCFTLFLFFGSLVVS